LFILVLSGAISWDNRDLAADHNGQWWILEE